MAVTVRFDEDPLTLKRTLWHEDQDGLTIVPQQNVEPILEANKRLHNSVDERARWKGSWHRVASIPMPLYMELERRGITKDPKAFARWLNDRDNRFFRTRPGRV